MEEKKIERRLVSRVDECGHICAKILSTHLAGMPDRICTLPDGGVLWVEVKATGEKPRAIQEYRHKQLRQRGQLVEVVSSYTEVDQLIAKYYSNR